VEEARPKNAGCRLGEGEALTVGELGGRDEARLDVQTYDRHFFAL
jgi:hypothetical protein